MITAIAAVDNKLGIGRDGDLLISIKEDMAHFRRTTMGAAVVMGRRTLESFPNKKPLPKRRNLVLTRNTRYTCEGAELYSDINALLEDIKKIDGEVFIIGGAEVYSLFLPYCDKLILTEIDADLNAEVFFPAFDKQAYERHILAPTAYEGDIAYTIVEYVRK